MGLRPSTANADLAASQVANELRTPAWQAYHCWAGWLSLSLPANPSCLTLHLHAALGVLKSDTEVVVAPHPDAQDVEVRLGRLDGRRLLAVEERQRLQIAMFRDLETSPR